MRRGERRLLGRALEEPLGIEMSNTASLPQREKEGPSSRPSLSEPRVDLCDLLYFCFRASDERSLRSMLPLGQNLTSVTNSPHTYDTQFKPPPLPTPPPELAYEVKLLAVVNVICFVG
eukprot:1395526-Amorphochlora_amoeboformis.AAC.1